MDSITETENEEIGTNDSTDICDLITDDLGEWDINSNQPLPPTHDGKMNKVEHGKLLHRITNGDNSKKTKYCYFCGQKGHYMATCRAYFVSQNYQHPNRPGSRQNSLTFCEYCRRRGHPIWTCFRYLRAQNKRQQRSVEISNTRDDPRNRGYFYGKNNWGVPDGAQNQRQNCCTVCSDFQSPDSPTFQRLHFDIPRGQNDDGHRRVPGYEGFLDGTETTVTDRMDRGGNMTGEVILSDKLTETMDKTHQMRFEPYLDRYTAGDDTEEMGETEENTSEKCVEKNRDTILAIIGGILILVANVIFLYFHQ